MLERAIMIYLALATVATAAIFPLPARAGSATSRADRSPAEPPAPTPSDEKLVPLLAPPLSGDSCAPCEDGLSEARVAVAGVVQTAWDGDETDVAGDEDTEAAALAAIADGEDDELAADLVDLEGFITKALGTPSTGEQLADFAAGLAGLPYHWGGTSPSTGFDCSGLVYFVHRQFGVTLGRDAAAQYGNGQVVHRGELEPGDIVFFSDTYASGISHDGIYLGGGRFIHAVQPGSGVKVTSMGDGYWGPRYVGARRVFA